jgi:hypothetical protein
MTTRPTVTVHIRDSHSREDDLSIDVQGEIVTPGLAITPALHEENAYLLTHVDSSLYIPGCRRCRTHIEESVSAVLALGIDWTATSTDLMQRFKADRDLAERLLAAAIGRTECTRLCDHPDAMAYPVRCNTCRFELTAADENVPLSLEEAQEWRDDHECEPDVDILAPVAVAW